MTLPEPALAVFEAVGVAAVAAISYGSTNLDNLVVVSAYAGKSGFRPLFVKLTFVFACLAVLTVSVGLAEAAAQLPGDRLRLLGLIPMAIGSFHLVRLIARRSGGAAQPAGAAIAPAAGLAAYAGLAAALLANSSDSVIVMAPLLAELEPALLAGCFAAALAMAIAMSALAGFLARHPAIGAHIEKYADWALPFVLIGVGALIFFVDL